MDVGAQDEPPARQLLQRLPVALNAAQQAAQRLVVLLGALQHLLRHVLGAQQPCGAALQRQPFTRWAMLTFSMRASFLISEMPVRKVSSGSSSTMSSWGCRADRARLVLHAELQGARGPPAPRLTLPPGIGFFLGLWMSSGCSNSRTVIPYVLLAENPHRQPAFSQAAPPKPPGPPVVIHKGDLLPAAQREAVPGGLFPVDVVDAIRAVVVARQHRAAHQLLGALVVEAAGALLADGVPAWKAEGAAPDPTAPQQGQPPAPSLLPLSPLSHQSQHGFAPDDPMDGVHHQEQPAVLFADADGVTGPNLQPAVEGSGAELSSALAAQRSHPTATPQPPHSRPSHRTQPP